MAKNPEFLLALDSFISDNRRDIKIIVTSLEIFEFLKRNKNSEFLFDRHLKYSGITVISDPYYQKNKLGFIMKSNEITFDDSEILL
jgi:hypothetical protein